MFFASICPPCNCLSLHSTLSNCVTRACLDALVEFPRAEVLVENISEWFSLFFLLYRCVLGQGRWAGTHWDPPEGFPAPGFAVLNIIDSVTWWLSG